MEGEQKSPGEYSGPLKYSPDDLKTGCTGSYREPVVRLLSQIKKHLSRFYPGINFTELALKATHTFCPTLKPLLSSVFDVMAT